MIGGYSGKPLAAKLGVKAGHRVLVESPPTGYRRTLGELPDDVVYRTTAGAAERYDVVQTFVASRATLSAAIRRAKRRLESNGALWVSWKKKASGRPADFNENDVRAAGLAHGLVDVKICAIDATWSGLKFVIPLRDR